MFQVTFLSGVRIYWHRDYPD